MTATDKILPDDVAAYLIEAARSLTEELGFIPASLEEMSQWMLDHTQEIGTRAKDAMQAFVGKMLSNQAMMDAACEIIGDEVHAKVNAAKDPNAEPDWNPRYLAYCKSQGLTPAQMKKRDKGSMAGYICWNGSAA